MSGRGLAAVAVALCLGGCPTGGPVNDAGEVRFWSLVKITSGESSFAFKCFHRQSGRELSVACFSPLEMPLFTVAVSGCEVTTTPSSPAVQERVPFDLSRIGRDVWRTHVAATDGDLESYRELNSTELPEDHVSVTVDARGRPVTKTFFAGDELVAEVGFLDYPGSGGVAGTVELTSHRPPYTIRIVQGAGP
jgi:hypothetical protein